MADFKVTDGTLEAGHGAGMRHWGTREAIAAAISHPDFRAQVAELMRGMVPKCISTSEFDTQWEQGEAYGHNTCHEEALARIQQWEEGA